MSKKRVLARVLAEDLRNVMGGDCPCPKDEAGTVGWTYSEENGSINDMTSYGGDED